MATLPEADKPTARSTEIIELDNGEGLRMRIKEGGNVRIIIASGTEPGGTLNLKAEEYRNGNFLSRKPTLDELTAFAVCALTELPTSTHSKKLAREAARRLEEAQEEIKGLQKKLLPAMGIDPSFDPLEY